MQVTYDMLFEKEPSSVCTGLILIAAEMPGDMLSTPDPKMAARS